MARFAPENREELYERAEDIGFAMLTTHNPDGTLYSCPMTLQERNSQGHLWFFLERNSQTAQHLQANINLSLSFANPEDSTFVAISGMGQLIDDPAMIEKLWSEELKTWFPKGKTDPQLALLRVDPQQGQYWDTPSSTLETVVGYVKNAFGHSERGAHIGENRKVPL